MDICSFRDTFAFFFASSVARKLLVLVKNEDMRLPRDWFTGAFDRGMD